jgi:hypothetical protein
MGNENSTFLEKLLGFILKNIVLEIIVAVVAGLIVAYLTKGGISPRLQTSTTESVVSTEIVGITPTPIVLVANPTSEFIPNAQVTYQTKFDDFMNWGQGGTVDIIANRLVIGGKSSGATHNTALRTGDGCLVLFRFGPGTSADIVLYNAINYGDKYVGIQIPNNHEFIVSLGYNGIWEIGRAHV